MSRRLNRLWALLVILMSSQALALGLGEIRLDSALNAPLRAEIRLLSATPGELENLTIQMASAETFTRYGIDRPAYLSSVNFRVVPSGRVDGNVIRVTSALPITEPFLTFLVEASWSRGRLLREYTVLLDPPTFAPPASEQVTQSVQPPVRSQPADSGEIRRPAPAPAPAPAPVRSPAASMPAGTPSPSEAPSANEPTPVTAADFDDTPGGDYRVQRGDTLWSLANRFRPDNRLTINQTMVAIFEANPQAFEDNINALSAGSNLRIPSADEVFRITRAQALAEVQRQNSAWSGGPGASATTARSAAPQPSLELVPPDEDSLSADSTTVYDGPEIADDAADAPSGLDSIRISEIEDLLADEQAGLVVISDNELAALRRELADLSGQELPAEPLPVDEPVAEDDVFVADEQTEADDEVFADDPETAAADDSEVSDTSPEPEVTAPAPSPVARQPQQSLVDTILGYLTGIWGMVGLAVILAVGVLLFFARRAARSGGEDDATAMWHTLDDDDFAEESQAERTSQMPTLDRADDTIVVEEGTVARGGEEPGGMTATMEIPPSAAPAPRDSGDDTIAAEQRLEDTFSSDTALNIDQSDPVAEADFHMAYGLYDQAADLINGALAVDPNRSDLVAKLCEIYFVWGNRDAFVDAAERFKGMLGDGEDPEWDKTVIMGQQIAGDHQLFSDAPGATKEVDLAFGDDGDDAALDMDLDSGPQDDDDFIDLGAEEPAELATSETNSAIDFVFDEVESGDTGETGTTKEMPEADPFTAAFADEDSKTAEMPSIEEPTAEMPTVESSLEDTAQSPTIDEQFADFDATGEMPAIGDDEVTRFASLDDDISDATSEINLDDLGLDLDSLDDGLDDTSESLALNDDFLDETGRNAQLADADPTGRNEAIVEESDGHDSSETNLLDATGQTQILPGDFAVETGTGTNIEKALADDDAMISSEAETMLASLDDDDDGDFDFAQTEALPDDAAELTGDLAGSTDIDLDLDDLTAALKVSTSSDTVNQQRDDSTVEQPRPSVPRSEESPTESISPDDMSDDLHDARTMTEVGTKLDLARAYVDMGDPSGARSILEEVLDEGDASQRQQAQQLLDSLPA